MTKRSGCAQARTCSEHPPPSPSRPHRRPIYPPMLSDTRPRTETAAGKNRAPDVTIEDESEAHTRQAADNTNSNRTGVTYVASESEVATRPPPADTDRRVGASQPVD